MRIIAGKLGGRQFDSPKRVSVHPMSEKVRGAIFNALGDIGGLSFLDAFAGSGALSFEAVSRGASQIIAIEKDKSAQRIITGNIKGLGLTDQIKLIKAGAGVWLGTGKQTFDVVLLDPPYDNLQSELLTKLATRSINIVVLSLPPVSEFVLEKGFELLSSKNYGDATLSFYRRDG
ncbi:MAG: RsmD family RNA methyltransferase [Candidatus Saccharimonadales bacterium]